MMTIQDLKSTVPAVFAKSASPNVSNKYQFASTESLLEKFIDTGWEIHSAKQIGQSKFAPHQIRLVNGQMPKVGDSVVQAIISNSHNATRRLSVSAGLFRLVCSNGLVVPVSVAESFSVMHMGIDFDEVQKITENFIQLVPKISASVSDMRSRVMSDKERGEFAINAAGLRWKAGQVPANISVESLLQPVRQEDQSNDLWTTFNVLQEKVIRGGVSYRLGSGRRSQMRSISNIDKNTQLNKKLWEMAESYI